MTDQKTSNPWEEQWGEGSSFLTPSQESIKTIIEAPWEQSWGEGVSYLKKAFPPPTRSSNPNIQFEAVFQNLMKAESGNRHRDSSGKLITSPVGAQGVTQVMPKTGRNPGYGIKPLQDDSEKEFVRFGRDYLSAMLKEFDGDYEKALAAYNAGPGSVKKAITRGGEEWKKYLPKKSETLPYIEKILGPGRG